MNRSIKRIAAVSLIMIMVLGNFVYAEDGIDGNSGNPSGNVAVLGNMDNPSGNSDDNKDDVAGSGDNNDEASAGDDGTGDGTGNDSEDVIEEPVITHPISGLKAEATDFETVKLTWNEAADYDGEYVVYTESDGVLTECLRTGSTSCLVKGLTAGRKYYFKVESDVLSSAVSVTVIREKNAVVKQIKSGTANWDIRIIAQQKLYYYDTVQGACSYNGYGYFALYNRRVERIKIAKVNLRTRKLVKVSAPLKSHCHGNTLAYNPKIGKVVVTCGMGGYRYIVYVDSKTLKQTGRKSISISESLLGAEYTGVVGLAYNREKSKYLLRALGIPGRIITADAGFKNKKSVRITGSDTRLQTQGIFTSGDYMFEVQSFKNGCNYNMITIRKLSGELVGKLRVSCGSFSTLLELENIFYDKTTGKWYASFYRSYRKTNGNVGRKNYLYTIENLNLH